MMCPWCKVADVKDLGQVSCREGIVDYFKCNLCGILFTEDFKDGDEEDIL